MNLNYTKKKELYAPKEEIPVSIYYYYDRKKLNVSTGVKVSLMNWNSYKSNTRSGNPVKKTDPSFKTKNLLLRNKWKEVQDIVDQISIEGQIPTIDLVKSFLYQKDNERVKKSLTNLHFLFILDEYRNWINSVANRNRESYKKSVRTCLKRIEEFTYRYQKKLGYKLLITDIDNDYQYALIDYLDKRGDTGEQPSTIRKRLKILVSMINWSRDEKKYTEHRIKAVKMKWDFRREVIYLKRTEIIKLLEFNDFDYRSSNHTEYSEEYITDRHSDGTEVIYTNLEVYRDMLLFGCGIGCRFSDLVKLKVGHGVLDEEGSSYFRYRMTKSEYSKEIKVPINKLTQQVFTKYASGKASSDYIFPRTKRGNPVSNQKFNKHLKEIGRLVGLERKVSWPKFNLQGQVVGDTDTLEPLYDRISSHIMRRTFIREGLTAGVPPYKLMELSGHTTEKVFKRYFDVLDEELDVEGKKIFDLNILTIDEEKLNGWLELLEAEGTNETHVASKILDKTSLLKELKSLFEDGLIPEVVYHKKVEALL